MGMIRLIVFSALFSLLASGAAADPTTRDPTKVPAGDYELDGRHASLVVKVPHMGFSRYTMRFNSVEGTFTYDPDNWQETKARITVDPKSIDTGDRPFSRTVAGYFEPDRFPVIAFESTAVTGDKDGRGQIHGNLTMHGVTRSVILEAQFNGVGPGVLGRGTRMGFSGNTRVKRSEFGITGGRPFAADTVDVIFEVEFVKKDGGG